MRDKTRASEWERACLDELLEQRLQRMLLLPAYTCILNSMLVSQFIYSASPDKWSLTSLSPRLPTGTQHIWKKFLSNQTFLISVVCMPASLSYVLHQHFRIKQHDTIWRMMYLRLKRSVGRLFYWPAFSLNVWPIVVCDPWLRSWVWDACAAFALRYSTIRCSRLDSWFAWLAWSHITEDEMRHNKLTQDRGTSRMGLKAKDLFIIANNAKWVESMQLNYQFPFQGGIDECIES